VSTLLREVTIGNNLTIRFIDRSRHYYGGFFQAAVEAVCEIPVISEYIQVPAEHDQAISILGQTANFSKVLVRMGVLEADLEQIREQLIDEFLETAAPYLAMEDFPSRFIHSEINKQLRRKVRTPGIPVNNA
jgi:hypothetical protein